MESGTRPTQKQFKKKKKKFFVKFTVWLQKCLKKQILFSLLLVCCCWIRDSRSGREKSLGIRENHPRSATLGASYSILVQAYRSSCSLPHSAEQYPFLVIKIMIRVLGLFWVPGRTNKGVSCESPGGPTWVLISEDYRPHATLSLHAVCLVMHSGDQRGGRGGSIF